MHVYVTKIHILKTKIIIHGMFKEWPIGDPCFGMNRGGGKEDE